MSSERERVPGEEPAGTDKAIDIPGTEEPVKIDQPEGQATQPEGAPIDTTTADEPPVETGRGE